MLLDPDGKEIVLQCMHIGTNLSQEFIDEYKDLLDPDGDGFSNIAEYKIDTDPLDAESKLAIDNFTVTNIAWRGGESVPQVLESTTDLNVGEWKPVATNIGSKSTFPIDNAFSTSNRFYRIVVPTELQR